MILGFSRAFPSSGITFLGALSNKGLFPRTLTLDFTSLNLQQNDFLVGYVIQVDNTSTSAEAIGVNSGSTGWTEEALQFADDNRNCTGRMFYKKMGSSPDTGVTVDVAPSSGKIGVVIVRAYRGVDPTTPFDVSTVFLSANNTGNPFVSSITPVTAGAVGVNLCGGSDAVPGDAATAGPTGWDNFLTDNNVNGGVFYGQLASCDFFGWTSGAIGGAAYAGVNTGAIESRVGATFVLRPA